MQLVCATSVIFMCPAVPALEIGYKWQDSCCHGFSGAAETKLSVVSVRTGMKEGYGNRRKGMAGCMRSDHGPALEKRWVGC